VLDRLEDIEWIREKRAEFFLAIHEWDVEIKK
jgi:hypothetical protein